MSVSVCIATYNGEAYIKGQLFSILKQLGFEDEIIISDDFSADGTCNVIKSFHDKRIILLENKVRSGVTRNFERALNLAKGDYILLSDQDDVWLENKVQTLLNYLKQYDVVQSDAAIVDSDLNVIHPSYFALTGSRTGFFHNLWRNSYMGCNMGFNRKVLELALPFPKNIPMHDLWIGFIGELFFSTQFVPEKLIYYRRHSSNVSQTGSKSPFKTFQKFKFRINVLRYLPLLFARRFFIRKHDR